MREAKKEDRGRRKVRTNTAITEKTIEELRAATDRRFAELASIIRADIRKLFDAEGQPKRIQDLPADVRLAIEDVDVDATGRIRRAQFKDKIQACEEALRIFGKLDDPAVVALLKKARENYRRVAEVLKASRAEVDPPNFQN